MVFWICWLLVAPFVFLLCPTRIIGRKNVRKVKKRGAILSCNHQSLIDPIILKTRVNTGFRLIAKASIFKNKFVGWLMRKFGAYPVNRGGNDITAVKTTLGHLKNNKHVVVFPEGTRGSSGELSELKHGLVSFALKTDCYVIPAVFRKKPKFLRFNTLLIDKPFKFSDFEEFRGVKVTHEVLDNACLILSEKMKYLKEINIKEFKKITKKGL